MAQFANMHNLTWESRATLKEVFDYYGTMESWNNYGERKQLRNTVQFSNMDQ